jgi:hypothetical protein
MKTLPAVCLILFFPTLSFCQARMIFNGANMLLTNGATVMLMNPAPDAMTINGTGGLSIGGPNDMLIWNIGNNAAAYQVPFLSDGIAIPVSFTTSGGTADGHMILSTYAGSNWQNSNYLPPTVTNVDRNGVDNSNHVIDRFWQVNATGYATPPSLTNLIFSYKDNEWSETGNQITETDMIAQNWNSISNSWNTPSAGTDNPSLNQFSIPDPGSTNIYPWWTLVAADFDLPLDLLGFTVEKEEKDAVLNWIVTKQINVDYFEVQRSTNAIDFMPIGKVAAVPGTLTTSYSFTDSIHNVASGIIYYRLRMVDQDGKFSFSPVKYISFTDDQTELLSLFPNPVTNMLVIRFGSIIEGNYQVMVYSESGSELQRRQIYVTKNSSFSFRRLSGMMAGTYIVSVTGLQFNKAFTVIYR